MFDSVFACLVEQFAIFWCGCYGGVLLNIDRVSFSKECVCCACDPSVNLCVPSIGLVFVYVGHNLLIYEFESWITGVCSPHVIYLCDFSYYVVG